MRSIGFLYCALLITSLSLNSVFAHSGKITGNIIDAETLREIPFVNVVLLPLGTGTSTDDSGNFIIENIPEGTYNLKCTHLGYQTVEVELVIIPEETITLNIEMVKAYFNLADILITSNYSPSETFRIINRIDTELRPINTSQDILRIIPGLVTAQSCSLGL